MNNRFNHDKQLQELIERYPEELRKHDIKIEIVGVLLDYIARSGQSIEEIFSQYPSLYESMFPTGEQVPDRTVTLIKAVLSDYRVRDRLRTAATEHSWHELTRLIDQIDAERKLRSSARPSSVADNLAKHKVDGVVWQLSDIHFGRLNALNLSPTDLANAFRDIVRVTPDFEPRLIIVSGDVSSCAEPSEFEEFAGFCGTLSRLLWDYPRPYRLLVVPGNHEATWRNDGTADKLSNFRKFTADSNEFITPFWSGSKMHTDSDGEVSVHRFDTQEAQDIPPFMLVRDKRLNLRVLLLISSYYSGSVPTAVQEVLKKIRQSQEMDYLKALFQDDTGEFSREYISHIRNNIRPHDNMTIAVTHHNLHQYGQQICKNPNAQVLLSVLAEKQIQLILHGHTHLVEKPDARRSPDVGEAYPVPCPPLCGIPRPGNTNGFMMHLIGPVDEPRYITSCVWSMDESGNFTQHPSRLRARYRFRIYKDSIEVDNTEE